VKILEDKILQRGIKMNRSLLKIEFAKLRLYFVVMLVVVGYVLFNPKPLKSLDMIAWVMGVAHGVFVGFLAFKDFGGVESFMFSRSFTRNKLFWHRWCLGFGLQFVTLAIVTVIIAIGLRSWIFSSNAYQPMIKFYELKILWSISFGMFAGFAVSMFFTLNRRILNAEKPNTIVKRITRFLSYAVIPLILAITSISSFTNSEIPPSRMLLLGWAYVIAINVVSLVAGRQCFIRMEINS
jgi:hypothetical protein